MILSYIDAGSGSLLVQLLVGGVAGIGAFLRYRMMRFRGRFGSQEKPERKD